MHHPPLEGTVPSGARRKGASLSSPSPPSGSERTTPLKKASPRRADPFSRNSPPHRNACHRDHRPPGNASVTPNAFSAEPTRGPPSFPPVKTTTASRGPSRSAGTRRIAPARCDPGRRQHLDPPARRRDREAIRDRRRHPTHETRQEAHAAAGTGAAITTAAIPVTPSDGAENPGSRNSPESAGGT